MKSAFAYEFEELCVNALRSSGGRVTDARRAVIHCLATATSAVSAKHVISKIEKSSKLPDIDQVSVYRILDTLVELGLVHRVFPSGDFIPCRHSHCKNLLHVLAHCTVCDTSEELDLPEEITSPIRWYLTKQVGFNPHEHIFQMNGTCKRCS